MAGAERRSTSSSEFKHLEEHGYGSVYFVDDHFLLQPKRIEAICDGVIDAEELTIQWGIEGRVDSVAQHLFPAMAKAHCRTRHVRDRERQPEDPGPAQERADARRNETAVTNAKKAGIEIVHGFFVVGIPDETEEDMRATFDFAAKLPLDTFGFNRLVCLSRHAAVAGIREARARQRRDRLVQVLQVLRNRSDLPAGRSDQ